MATFVTLADAKAHLRITMTDDDAEIQLKLDQAEAKVLERCNSTAWWRAITPTWTAETVPGPVAAAILLVVTHLYEHRGEDLATDETLWTAIDRLIGQHKDPVLA